ncbi:hypothetical protein [Streptomyces sp. JNUCC 63]
MLGLAVSLVDITEQHLAATEAVAARQRLARTADASARSGTTLGLDTTAGEPAEMRVPALADLAAVDVLDDVSPRCPSSGASRRHTPARTAATAVWGARCGAQGRGGVDVVTDGFAVWCAPRGGLVRRS